MRRLAAVAAVSLASAVASSVGLAGATRELAQVDVSKALGTQSETTITVDPTNDRILLAGSNDHRRARTYAYGSIDGGATWTRSYLPLGAEGSLGASDPIVAIDRTGRQYAGFVRVVRANGRDTTDLRVAHRVDASSPWVTPTAPVEDTSGSVFADKPAMAVDVGAASPYVNRVYVGWSRITRTGAPIAISHSDDGGLTWSPPATVDLAQRGTFESYPSIAVGADGSVYVAWWDPSGRGIFADVSHDGGETFGPDLRVDPIVARSSCSPAGVAIPAQPTNCVRPNPIISVDNSAGAFAGRVYVTYGDTGGKRSEQDVFVAALRADPALRVQFTRRRINRPDGARRSDQFWPASAVDESTGVVWACFYDTRGDRLRRRAFYSCTRSLSGGAEWTEPVRVASVASNETQRGADTRTRGFHREYGDYEGLAVANGVAHPIWTDSRRVRTLGEEVYTTTLSEQTFRARSQR